MNKQYIVAYISNNTHNIIEYYNQQYEVFTNVEYDNPRLSAQIFYEKLLLDENTDTANLCEIIESTDY